MSLSEASRQLWCQGEFRLVAEGFGQTRSVVLHQPFARLGTLQGCDLLLGGPGMPRRLLYLHATPQGVFALPLTPKDRFAPMPQGWFPCRGRFHVGPYRITWEWQPVPEGLSDSAGGKEVTGLNALPDLSARGSLAQPRVVLVLIDDQPFGQHSLSRCLTLVGRKPPAHVIFTSRSVSSCHCVLVARGQHAWVVDLCSGNATLVDGQPVTAAFWATGARVTLGRVTLILQSGSPQKQAGPSLAAIPAFNEGLAPDMLQAEEDWPAVSAAQLEEILRDVPVTQPQAESEVQAPANKSALESELPETDLGPKPDVDIRTPGESATPVAKQAREEKIDGLAGGSTHQLASAPTERLQSDTGPATAGQAEPSQEEAAQTGRDSGIPGDSAAGLGGLWAGQACSHDGVWTEILVEEIMQPDRGSAWAKDYVLSLLAASSLEQASGLEDNPSYQLTGEEYGREIFTALECKLSADGPAPLESSGDWTSLEEKARELTCKEELLSEWARSLDEMSEKLLCLQEELVAEEDRFEEEKQKLAAEQARLTEAWREYHRAVARLEEKEALLLEQERQLGHKQSVLTDSQAALAEERRQIEEERSRLGRLWEEYQQAAQRLREEQAALLTREEKLRQQWAELVAAQESWKKTTDQLREEERRLGDSWQAYHEAVRLLEEKEREITQQAEKAHRQLAEVTEAQAALRYAMAAFEQEKEKLAHERTQIADAWQQLRQEEHQLAERAASLAERERLLHERLTELETARAEIEKDKQKLEEQAASLSLLQQQTQQVLEERERILAAREAALAQRENELERAQQQWQREQVRLRELQTALADWEQRLTSWNEELEQLRKRQDTQPEATVSGPQKAVQPEPSLGALSDGVSESFVSAVAAPEEPQSLESAPDQIAPPESVFYSDAEKPSPTVTVSGADRPSPQTWRLVKMPLAGRGWRRRPWDLVLGGTLAIVAGVLVWGHCPRLTSTLHRVSLFDAPLLAAVRDGQRPPDVPAEIWPKLPPLWPDNPTIIEKVKADDQLKAAKLVQEKGIDWVLETAEVGRTEGLPYVTLSLTCWEAASAQQILTRWCELYWQELSIIARRTAQQALEKCRQELVQIEGEEKRLRSELDQIATQFGDSDPRGLEVKAKEDEKRLNVLREELTQLTAEIEAIRKKQQEAQAILDDPAGAISPQELAQALANWGAGENSRDAVGSQAESANGEQRLSSPKPGDTAAGPSGGAESAQVAAAQSEPAGAPPTSGNETPSDPSEAAVRAMLIAAKKKEAAVLLESLTRTLGELQQKRDALSQTLAEHQQRLSQITIITENARRLHDAVAQIRQRASQWQHASGVLARLVQETAQTPEMEVLHAPQQLHLPLGAAILSASVVFLPFVVRRVWRWSRSERGPTIQWIDDGNPVQPVAERPRTSPTEQKLSAETIA